MRACACVPVRARARVYVLTHACTSPKLYSVDETEIADSRIRAPLITSSFSIPPKHVRMHGGGIHFLCIMT